MSRSWILFCSMVVGAVVSREAVHAQASSRRHDTCIKVLRGDTLVCKEFGRVKLIGVEAGSSKAMAVARKLVLDKPVQIEVCTVRPGDDQGNARALVLFYVPRSKWWENLSTKLLRLGVAKLLSDKPCHIDTGAWGPYGSGASVTGGDLAPFASGVNSRVYHRSGAAEANIIPLSRRAYFASHRAARATKRYYCWDCAFRDLALWYRMETDWDGLPSSPLDRVALTVFVGYVHGAGWRGMGPQAAYLQGCEFMERLALEGPTANVPDQYRPLVAAVAAAVGQFVPRARLYQRDLPKSPEWRALVANVLGEPGKLVKQELASQKRESKEKPGIASQVGTVLEGARFDPARPPGPTERARIAGNVAAIRAEEALKE